MGSITPTTQDTPASDNAPSEAQDSKPKVEPVIVNKWDHRALTHNVVDIVTQETEALLPDHHAKHTNTDVKLAILFLACAFAGYACVYGFLVPHPESSFVVGVCVIAYFVLTALFTVYTWFFESGCIVKLHSDKTTVAVSISLERLASDIEFHVAVSPATGGTPAEFTHKTALQKFVYETGEISRTKLHDIMKSLLQQGKVLQIKDE
eukprot:m.358597 g.358597  ORF g.358597 m.358597 type:complete len:207 (+) comp18193_c0_seq1:136-756(+)